MARRLQREPVLNVHRVRVGFLLLAAAAAIAPSTIASAGWYGWLQVGAPASDQQATDDDVQAYWAGRLREADRGGSMSILGWPVSAEPVAPETVKPPKSPSLSPVLGGMRTSL